MFVVFFTFAFSPPASFSDLYRAGLVALQQGDLTSAKSNLQNATKLEPTNGRAWIALGQTCWRLHESVDADGAVLKALAFSAEDAIVLQAVVFYYSESGQVLKAARVQSKLAALNPADAAASERAATLYFDAAKPLLEHEEFADAVAILETGTKSAQTEIALGVAYYGLRRFDEAANAFFSAIALDSGAKQPYVFLGRMLEQIPDRLPEATQRFVELEKANPSNYEGYLLHAKVLDARAIEPETSKKLLEKAIALQADDASSHLELGTLLESMHQYKEAAAAFEDASRLDPKDAATHYRLSRIYDRLGKADAARAERERHRALIAAQNDKR